MSEIFLKINHLKSAKTYKSDLKILKFTKKSWIFGIKFFPKERNFLKINHLKSAKNL